MIERHEAHARIEKLIVERWSPRSFDSSEIPQEDLDVIFEAAGWAPSSYNIQPWRFLYSKRGDENWERFLSLLIEFNQSWAKNASVLIFVVSDTLSRQGDKPKSNRPHSFDAGAAWQNMALQATAMGYHAHGMIGLDIDRAQQELGVPQDHKIEAAVAIGRQDAKEKLPDALQEREEPSGRNPVSQFAMPGNFR